MIPYATNGGITMNEHTEQTEKARWIKCEDEYGCCFECSWCGEQPLKKHGEDYFSDYCPYCGMPMEVENE